MLRCVAPSRSTVGKVLFMTFFSKHGLFQKFRFTQRFFFVAAVVVLLVLGGVLFLVTCAITDQAEERGAHLKIGFSPDWEYGSRKKLAHKLTNQAPVELTKVVEYLNTEYQPDLVVGGGDYVESSAVKPEKAKQQLAEINAIFKRLKAPRMYALGNHDMRSLSKADVMDILGIPAAHSVKDKGAWRVVVFDTNFNQADDSDRNVKSYTVGYVSQKELNWLDQALDTDRPTIVFSHHSPINTHNIENIVTANIVNADQVRALFERHKNVIAVVSGHTPQPQYQEINGIGYFVGDTLVNESGLGAFATIDLWYNPFSTRAEVVFEHYGRNRQSYSMISHMVRDRFENGMRMTKKFLFEE